MVFLKKNTVDERVEEELADFGLAKAVRNKPYRLFNSAYDGTLRDLNQYIDYSQGKFNQYIEYPADTEEYEIQLSLPNIRNKMMAILARLSSQRMKAEFFPQNSSHKVDKIVTDYLRDVFEWSDDKSNHDVVNFYWMLETAMKGTGILLEDYFKYTRVIKDIKETKEDGSSVWKKRDIVEDGLQAYVLPLEEVYIWNIREPNIQKQHKVYWASTMPLADFKHRFRNYPKTKDVIPGGSLALDDKSFFNEYLNNVPEGHVQVLHMWSAELDEFKIIANNEELTEEDNPIPFKHKKIPLVKNIYEPIAADFFYGKAFPDIVGNISDSIDQLFNDLFNLNQLRMKAPILAQTGTVLSDVIWRTDNVVEYDGEKPEQMKVSGGGNDVDRLNNILFGQLNDSSVSPVGQGQVGSGSTAREVVLAEEHANERMNMFLRFMEWGEKDRADMRIKNILQFFTRPLIGQHVAEEKNYRVFVQNNVSLNNGTIGTREIRFKPAEQITPPAVLEKLQRDDLEIIEMDIDFIRNLDLYTRIIPNSSVKMSEALRKALTMEFTQGMVTFFPDLTNRPELAVEYVRDYDKNPDKLIKKLEEQKSPEEQFEMMFGQGVQPALSGASASQQLNEAGKPLRNLAAQGVTNLM